MFLIQKKWKISEMQYDRFIPRFRKKNKTYKKGTTGLFQRQKNSKNFPEGGDRFISRYTVHNNDWITISDTEYMNIKNLWKANEYKNFELPYSNELVSRFYK